MLERVFYIYAFSVNRFVISSSNLFAQQTVWADSMLILIDNADDAERYRLEAQMIAMFYVAQPDSAIALNKRILEIDPGLKNQSMYIKALIHSQRYLPFPEKVKSLRNAVSLAKREDDSRLIADAYMFLGIAFRDNAQPDSAMIYALMSRDLYEEHGDSHDVRAILQLIADMRFYAGEYEQAKIIYNRILEYKNVEPWIGWRHRIITANLGLISIKQNRPEEAEKYFLICLDTLNAIKNLNFGDSTAYSYIYRKLMEVYLLKNDFKKAEYYFNLGEKFSINFKAGSELPGLYIGKSSILLLNGKIDSALAALKLAEKLELQYPDLKYKMDIFRGFADIYQMQGDFRKAGLYLEKLLTAKTLGDSIFNRARIMHLYAHHNYMNSVQREQQYKNERNLFYIITALSTLSLTVFIYLFFRIRKSYRVLIEKNLNLAYSSPETPIPLLHDYEQDEELIEKENFKEAAGHKGDISSEAPEESSVDASMNQVNNLDDSSAGEGRSIKQLEPVRFEEIKSKLNHAIIKDKIYLDSNISLSRLAESIGTNRTYLSIVLHEVHNMNFIEFINGHRVKEAIKLMSSPEAKEFTLDGIAEKSGFNNRITFSKVFREHTGINPSYFMKNLTLSDIQHNIARAD